MNHLGLLPKKQFEIQALIVNMCDRYGGNPADGPSNSGRLSDRRLVDIQLFFGLLLRKVVIDPQHNLFGLEAPHIPPSSDG
jgi:hypothetical protein